MFGQVLELIEPKVEGELDLVGVEAVQTTVSLQ